MSDAIVVEEADDGAGDRADLSPWVAMQDGLRRDLRRFVSEVGATPVTDRGAWRALRTRWGLFGLSLEHCLQWERQHLWPLLPSSEHGADIESATGRAEAVVKVVRSCDAVLERLAVARDEDALATAQARVQVACVLLEHGFDAERTALLEELTDPGC